MAVFMATQSAAVREAEALRAQLKAFEGARPVRALDPRDVRPSRWANRHEHAYADADFAALKADIASAGTNVQPVGVRALAADAATAGFELVFGHRRHRACLELGLALQAMVVEMNDQQLFEAMERENRARKNLSAWEQGTMYKRALDEGLYPSQRRLSQALGVDVSLVSKSLSLARLPPAVVAAFASPLEIQFRWAQPLAEALQRDPEAVLARAALLRQLQGRAVGRGAAAASPAQPSAVGLPAAQVLQALQQGLSDAMLQRLDSVSDAAAAARQVRVAEAVLNGSTPLDHRLVAPPPAQLHVAGSAGRSALLKRDAQGAVRLQFSAGAIDQAAWSRLQAFVEQLLGQPESG